MKFGLIFSSATIIMALSNVALADSTHATPVRLGFGVDLGVPSGAAVGLVLHPKEDWLTLQTSFTYVLGPGGRLSVQLDPMSLLHNPVVGVFADVQAGFNAKGSVPGHSSDLPSFGWDYVNLYGGLRFGKPSGFHWVLEGGPSYVHLTTSNFQAILSKVGKDVTVGNPTANGWFVPTVLTGFAVTWDVK